MLRTLKLMLLAMAVVIPSRAASQVASSDSLPFRRGQWAAQFRPPADAGGFGVLRFRTRSSAWILDVRARFDHDERRQSGVDGTRTSTIAGADLRVGLRRYHFVIPRVARYHTFGVTGGFQTYRAGSTQPGVPEQSHDRLSGGVYGDLGGVFFVIPQLSLGASAQAMVNLSGERLVTDALPPMPRQESRSTGWGAFIGGVTVLATLYF